MSAAVVRCPLLLGRHPAAALRRSFSSSRMRPVRGAAGGGSQGRSPAYGGLLLDAGGTLLQLAQPVAETYAALGRPYGVMKPKKYIMEGFKRAFSAPWPKTLRYQGDGRPFWRIVVAEATNCTNNDYFEEVYQYYAHGDAWRLPDGAYRTLRDLKDAGVKLAVVSNFDTRLRKLLKDLNVSDMFDAIVVSSEVGYEKPAPEIFKIALGIAEFNLFKLSFYIRIKCNDSRPDSQYTFVLKVTLWATPTNKKLQHTVCLLGLNYVTSSCVAEQIGVEARNAVHVGDDETADKAGANAIGLECWLWGEDVKKFSEIQHRIVAKGSR